MYRRMLDERLGVTTIVDQMDVHPGGSWRFLMRNSDGSESGTYSRLDEVLARLTAE
jgi:uncharacterized protein YndB with AHSA1/START domain